MCFVFSVYYNKSMHFSALPHLKSLACLTCRETYPEHWNNFEQMLFSESIEINLQRTWIIPRVSQKITLHDMTLEETWIAYS